MMVNPISLTVGDRAQIKEYFISKNSDNHAYYGTINEELWADHKLCMSSIKVITKLPNSEQSYKGKVKTHNYINRQNQSTIGKL